MKYSLTRLDYNSIKELGNIDFNADHIFDLSSLDFAKPDGIVSLRLILHKLCNDNGRSIKIIFPKKSNSKYDVRSYLNHINFFKDLNLKLDTKDKLLLLTSRVSKIISSNPTHTLLIDSNGYDVDSKMNKLVSVLVNFLRKNGHIRENKERIYRTIFEEAFLNLRTHSNPDGEPAYFCAHAQVYNKGKSNIVLSIGDCGIGVRKSLNSVFSYNSDQEALQAAIEEQKSRFVEDENHGGGARYIFEKCRTIKLNCLFRSGNAEIKQSKGRQDFTYDKNIYIPGTQLIMWN